MVKHKAARRCICFNNSLQTIQMQFNVYLSLISQAPNPPATDHKGRTPWAARSCFSRCSSEAALPSRSRSSLWWNSVPWASSELHIALHRHLRCSEPSPLYSFLEPQGARVSRSPDSSRAALSGSDSDTDMPGWPPSWEFAPSTAPRFLDRVFARASCCGLAGAAPTPRGCALGSACSCPLLAGQSASPAELLRSHKRHFLLSNVLNKCTTKQLVRGAFTLSDRLDWQSIKIKYLKDYTIEQVQKCSTIEARSRTKPPWDDVTT